MEIGNIFVKRYKKQIIPRVQTYLTSKKLSIDKWLTAVKDRRCGDILCLYLLNMITGRHTCVHLKNGQLWSTLKSVLVNHDDHVNNCDFHLVYLGFGTFI